MNTEIGTMEMLRSMNHQTCSCGKPHEFWIDNVIAGKGVIDRIPEFIKRYHATRVFVLADCNTFQAAGETVCTLLKDHEIPYQTYVLSSPRPEPDEWNVGSVVMHFDPSCDLLIGVGSGVVNDIGKIVSNVTGRPYIIVATAPSMDGFASATSSMSMDGLKVSLPSKCADVMIGDTDILATAPDCMLQAGLGDMLAKYISICEWRISNLITGEYYCPRVAELIRLALQRCVQYADGLLSREPEALQAVFEGLVAGGIAMNYAGLSRPASGVEHYFSHIWDMRGAAFGTPVDLHGIQCGIGTLLSLKLYQQLRQMTPNREKALRYAQSFDYTKWSEQLTEFVGEAAQSMIANEKKEHKYDLRNHAKRLEAIMENWSEILRIMDEELPDYDTVEGVLDRIHAPKTLEEIGIDSGIIPLTFQAAKDIRAKYVLSMLAWDLGIIDEFIF